MAKYRMYDRPRNGTPGQDCGVFRFDDLPQRVRAAIVAEPDAGEWVLPALSDGDRGHELDDLQTIVTEC